MEDIEVCKNHLKYEEFSQIQEKVLRPILVQANSMNKQLAIDCYYKPEISHEGFKILYEAIEK